MYNNISTCIITLIINSSLGHIVSILFLISQFVNIINQIPNTPVPLPPVHHRESWHQLVWFINSMLHISVKLLLLHVYLMCFILPSDLLFYLTWSQNSESWTRCSGPDTVYSRFVFLLKLSAKCFSISLFTSGPVSIPVLSFDFFFFFFSRILAP